MQELTIPSVSMASTEEKHMNQSPVPFFDEHYEARHEFKIFVGIDFGTDGSGLAYSLRDGSTYIHNLWRDVSSTEKPKTSVLFDNHGEVQCHGNQAVIQYISSMSNDGWKLFERFKMKLYDTDPSWKREIRSIHNNRDSNKKKKKKAKVDLREEIESTNNSRMRERSETVFVAQLKFLKHEAMTFIHRNFKRKRKMKFNQDDIQWILTVPAIWSDAAKQRMKDWAMKAGLIEGHIANQLKIVYEPDCASLSIQHAVLRNIMRSNEDEMDEKEHSLLPHRPKIAIDLRFKKGDKYILLDVGGGTCDVACHEVMGEFAIAEVLHPSGGPWGACNIDREFELMLDDIFSKEWMSEFRHDSPNMYQQLLQNFISKSKVTFYEESQRKYHQVMLPSNFGDFLIDKLEEQLLNNNEEDNKQALDSEELLARYLRRRCSELYKNGALITMKERSDESSSSYYGYAMSLHFDLWKKLFNIVVDPIVEHVANIVSNAAMKRCKYILMVGGFSNANYLQQRIKYEFGERVQIVIPQHPQLCVVDGAARYGLRPNFMKVRRLSKSYGIQTNKSLASLKKDLHLFPAGYLASNTYFDTELQQKYVKQCFCVFGVKNKAMSIEQKATKKAVYKMTREQKKMQIEIFQSDKTKPMTTSTLDACTKLGDLVIDLPDSMEYKVWVEFKYTDTMLVVYAYPNNRRDLKIESRIQYN